MKLRENLFYLITVAGGVGLGYWIVLKGRLLENGADIVDTHAEGSAWQHFQEAIGANLVYPLATLLMQVTAIILVARLFGLLFRRIGQPSVIGEIVAGIALGPSLLGYYFPEVSGFLFPPESLGNLSVMSQVGLILFMFVVGMELDLRLLKNQAHEAVVISHASIVFPFLPGSPR